MGTYTCSSVTRGPSGHISRRGVHISYPQCLQPQSGDCSDTWANDGHLKALLHFRAHQELQGDSLVDAATWGKRNSLAKGMAMYTLLHINANQFPNIYGLESLQESYYLAESKVYHSGNYLSNNTTKYKRQWGFLENVVPSRESLLL